MGDRPLNVLFLCTGNSARSILAEAIMNHLAIARGRFRAFSAGSIPKGHVHPLTVDLLGEMRIPIEGLRSKSWAEFTTPGAPQLDFVFTVCDKAAAEPCACWPGQPMTAHWGIPDPAEASGPLEQQRKAFREALIHLRRRIELFASLPLESVNRMALQQRLDEIGEQ
jgi:arsenate reductase